MSLTVKRFCLSVLTLTLASISLAASPDYSCTINDTGSINNAILRYVEKKTGAPIKNVQINSEKCLGSHASAMIHLIEPVTNAAMVCLSKEKQEWRVIALGDRYDEKDMAGFPKELRNDS